MRDGWAGQRSRLHVHGGSFCELIFFFLKIFHIFSVCVSAHTHVYRYLQKPEEGV